MSEEESTIFRRVYFFRVEHFAQLKDSIPDALRRISSLDFNDKGRYKIDPTSGLRFSVYPDTDEYPLKIRFGKIRRDALPQIEHGGDLRTLELKEDAGLIDICHAIIFADGYVAAEWNPDGPKLASLGGYLFEKGRLNTAPKFLSLLERDIVEVVRGLDSVRVLEIELPPDAIALAREADKNLAAAVEAAAALGASKRTSLTLTAEKGTLKLKELAVRLAQIIIRNPQERALLNNLSVKGYRAGSRASRFIDILESKLVSGEYLPRTNERSRSVKTNETYDIIESLYESNRDRISSAAETPDL